MPLHVLVMTDRDWTHPQGGGTGTNLYGQITRWIAWGHRVTVIACSYPGAKRHEQLGDGLEIHRMGGRSTVFPRAIFAQWRGLVPDADVVLEVVNGITFLTPLWLDAPRVTLVHHVHRQHFVEEMGPKGKIAAFLLETAPLRWLYRGSRFLTISHATAREVAAHAIPLEQVEVGYIGVEADAFGPGERAERPELLYLGRLKRYKRIEVVLDALEAIPEATLQIAGDGDHREELEREIAERGLGDRVVMHGFVNEERKRELLQRAWVNLTASSAEGWALSVMEAAACGTPSVALNVGGLGESIVHDETGLLAESPEGLVNATRALVHDPALRERLGDAALERARLFTWDSTAARTLDVLDAERERAATRGRSRTTASFTRSAAGLATALAANTLIALVVTVLFARSLGAGEYGDLGALLAAFALLAVPAAALQASVARAIDAGSVGAAGVRHWLRQAAIATVAAAAAAALLRVPLAQLLGIDEAWAAAAVPPAAGLFLVLSIARGALQGLGREHAVGLSLVGDVTARLLIGIGLVAAGAGVAGAFLGTPLGLLAMCVALARPLHRALGDMGSGGPSTGTRFRALLAGSWAPLAAFLLIAVLQNLDVIFVSRNNGGADVGAYVAASTTAKAVIWFALGLSVYLLPMAVRRSRAGGDARAILAGALGLVAAVALPMIAVYDLAGATLLRAVFGAPEYARAAEALPLLTVAMALLGSAYVLVQYLLAVGRERIVAVLALVTLAEPFVLVGAGAGFTSVATALVAIQVPLAAVVLAIAMRRVTHLPKGAPA